MRMRSKLQVAVSVAACVAALAAGLASANRLSVIAKPIRATWTEMEFTVGSRFMMRCPVTLEGSFFSSTFAKVARLLVGAITRASAGSCGTEFRATPLVESGTPWYIRYEGFTGTLPNITGLPVGVVGEAWLLEVRNTLWCLFRSEAAEPAVARIPVSLRQSRGDRLELGKNDKHGVRVRMPDHRSGQSRWHVERDHDSGADDRSHPPPNIGARSVRAGDARADGYRRFMAKRSAGILLFRRSAPAGELEVLLVHPGGPFWAKRDLGAWSIPKGEVDAGEAEPACALRELAEETGTAFPDAVEADLVPLGEVRQRSGKVVAAWALEGDLDADAVVSNTFELRMAAALGARADVPGGRPRRMAVAAGRAREADRGAGAVPRPAGAGGRCATYINTAVPGIRRAGSFGWTSERVACVGHAQSAGRGKVMRRRSALCKAPAVAALALSVVVSVASANRIQFTSQGIRGVWREAEFIGNETIAFNVRCQVTMEGSMHAATIAKVQGSLIGYITRASVGTCEGGRVIVLSRTLPWHIRYDTFFGALPAFSAIRTKVYGEAWLIEPSPGLSCLYVASDESPSPATASIGAEGEIREIHFEREVQLPEAVGSMLCPRGISQGSSGSPTRLGSTQKVFVFLMEPPGSGSPRPADPLGRPRRSGGRVEGRGEIPTPTRSRRCPRPRCTPATARSCWSCSTRTRRRRSRTSASCRREASTTG